MNRETDGIPTGPVGDTAGAAPAVAQATKRIQRWFLRPYLKSADREEQLCLQERLSERARIARDLHDTLFQGFLGVSLQLHNAVEKLPADSPARLTLNGTLSVMQRVLDEGRDVLHGLRSSAFASMNLEQALSALRDEFQSDGTAQFRVFVNGQPKALKPAIREQIYLMGREALVNALRHSQATNIEAEVEYLPSRVRLVVRDNGCGMDPHAVECKQHAHWGLLGMRERAAAIGAQLRIWSRLGSGTEVEISVPGAIMVDAQA